MRSDDKSASKKTTHTRPQEENTVREAPPSYPAYQLDERAEAEEKNSVSDEEKAAEILKLDRQGTYTVEDYHMLPDDRRFELIDGELIEMDSPSWLHQSVLRELVFQIMTCIELKDLPCELQFAPCDVQIDCDEKTMVEPDLLVVCKMEEVPRKAFQGAPDFIIEVLSPSNPSHDLVRKRKKYESAGVREYWIVDPEKQLVRVICFEKKQPERVYTFESVIEIGISQGYCAVDFEKIKKKTAPYYTSV